MPTRAPRAFPWLAGWLVVAVAGALALVTLELARLREDFDTQARIAHRLLSQRAAQHDAILATLALLQPPAGSDAIERLPSIHPQILSVRQGAFADTPAEPTLAAAEGKSRELRRPVLASADLAQGRAWLVLAAYPASFAMQIDLRAALGPMETVARPAPPAQLSLARNGETLLLQPGSTARGWWLFEVDKPISSESHPFRLTARQPVTWGEWPWGRLLLWLIASAAVCALAFGWTRQRSARRRAEALLRVDQVSRLNTLGELGAGLAHELNQPLTAILADNQAATRLLAQEPPDIDRARQAMAHAVQQARRASEVVQRLRRTVEQRGEPGATGDVKLLSSARDVLRLLEPEMARQGVSVSLEGDDRVEVKADPVAVEQVIHNLLLNALQALGQVPATERKLMVRVDSAAGVGTLAVEDSGPGIPPEHAQRIFEPFFTTRSDGLGLGLSLCQGLAEGMDGALRASARAPRGARFEFSLPLAAA